MILITVVDDRNGLMFNHRRLSRDRILNKKILSITQNGKLWMSSYSTKMFQGMDGAERIIADDDFLQKASGSSRWSLYVRVQNIIQPSFYAVCFAGKSLPNIQWENGAAAKKFQRNAIGKFFNNVPTQMAGSCVMGAPAKAMLNKREAIRLIDGHMTATVAP